MKHRERRRLTNAKLHRLVLEPVIILSIHRLGLMHEALFHRSQLEQYEDMVAEMQKSFVSTETLEAAEEAQRLKVPSMADSSSIQPS